MNWSYHVLLPGEPRSAGHARVFAHGVLEDHELTRLRGDVSLVVGELAANAAVHARTPFVVTVSGHSTALFVRVRDLAPSAPVLRQLVGRADDDPALGGRGLMLVEAVSTAWGVDPGPGGGKSVWAMFDLD